MKTKHAKSIRSGVSAARRDVRNAVFISMFEGLELDEGQLLIRRRTFGLAGRAYSEYMLGQWRTFWHYGIELWMEGNLVQLRVAPRPTGQTNA